MPKCMRITYSRNHSNKRGFVIPNVSGDKKLGAD